MSYSPSVPSVGCNARAFTINGQPEILLSIAIPYFRVPHELWADRIAKAKRGGMNTIETSVAWNVHEPEQGTFLFEGDQNLDAFLDECQRQGMYVIVRPGPDISTNRDSTGFPSWLFTVADVERRLTNGSYRKALDDWFDTLIGIIEARQWTKGGPVILMELENQSANEADTVESEAHSIYVCKGLLARGITVPLIVGVDPDSLPTEYRIPDRNTESSLWRSLAEGKGGSNYYVYQVDREPTLFAPLLMKFGS